jgi:hypothetical protein
LETDWWNDFNSSSTVKPVLKLLSQGVRVQVPFVHRDIGTREEFEHYCRKWRQSSCSKYPILYLAFHGEPGCILVGDGRRSDHKVTLDELADLLGSGLNGRMVHFGSCATLALDARHIQRFLKKTGIVAAAGYREWIDWLYSSVFDVIFMETVLRYPISLDGARRIAEAIRTEHGPMSRTLDFRMVVRNGRAH